MSNKQNDNTSLILILFLLIAFSAYKLWLWGKPLLISFYFEHRLAIAFVAAVLIYFLINRIAVKIMSWNQNRKYDNAIAGDDKADSAFLGYQDNGKKFSLKLDYRKMHMQVIGTTNAGKTESVLVPLMIDDIEKGRGFIIIDGKSDMSLLRKIHSYVRKADRAHDFMLFSLTDYDKSYSYNPLVDGAVDQVAEKIINSFGFENEYYRTVQFEIFKNVLVIFKEANEYPTFLKIQQALLDPTKLNALAICGGDVLLQEWANDFMSMNKDSRREQISGLMSNLGYFVSKDLRHLFNVEHPKLRVSELMEKGKICYFQLPVLKSPILGKSVAKMVLQDIQSQVSVRHASAKKDHQFYGIYLDDFTEYLTKSFVSVLNKSRSANVGVTFAHQAIGDLEALGAEVKNQIQTNANIKVFMRTNEPESTEYFAKTIGTVEGVKTTSRQKEGSFGRVKVTADGSIREVEEFINHPNQFKRELGRGEGIVIVPHERGAKSFKVKFVMRPNMIPYRIENTDRDIVEYLNVESYQPQNEALSQVSNTQTKTVQQTNLENNKIQLMNTAREKQTTTNQSGSDAALGKAV